MLVLDKYFELLAEIKLYSSNTGRSTYIADGYRPRVFFGLTDPVDPNYSSDCIIKLINQQKLMPGESATVRIYVLKYFYLRQLLMEDTKLRIKEGPRTIGEGKIVGVLGEKVSHS